MEDSPSAEGRPLSQSKMSSKGHATHSMNTSNDTPGHTTPPPDYQPPPTSKRTKPRRQRVDKSKLEWCPDDIDTTTMGAIVAFFFSIIFCLLTTAAFLFAASGFIFGAHYDDAVEDICSFNNVTVYSECTYTEDCEDCIRRSCSGREAMYCYDTLNGTCDNDKYCQIASFSSCYCDTRVDEWAPSWMGNGTPSYEPKTDTELTCWIERCGSNWMGPGGDWTTTHADEYTNSGVKALAWFFGFMTVMCLLLCFGCRNHPKCCLYEYLQENCCASKKE